MIKKDFRGYIPYTDEEKKEIWDNGTFVFDANSLLNLYRYSISTRNRFLGILDHIKDDIWIPHQVAKEYFRNRCTVLYNQHQLYKDIRTEAGFLKMKDLLNKNKDKHSSIDCEKLLKFVEIAEKNILKVLKKAEDEEGGIKYNQDDICNKILGLFENKYGTEYTPDQLKALYAEGKIRFEAKIPPGYMDDKKPENEKYGDLILWKQIIEYATEKKKNIIFITDDKKEDWIQRSADKAIIGPRQELIQEISKNAGVDCLIYRSQQFLEIATSTFELDDSELANSLDEVRKIDEADTVDMDEIMPYTQGIKDLAANMRDASIAVMPYTQKINDYMQAAMIPYQKINDYMQVAMIPYQRINDMMTATMQTYNEKLNNEIFANNNKLITQNLTLQLEKERKKTEE